MAVASTPQYRASRVAITIWIEKLYKVWISRVLNCILSVLVSPLVVAD
jgi:hypothetical protein